MYGSLVSRKPHLLDAMTPAKCFNQMLVNAAIAEKLVLSAWIARNHVSNIFGKLQVVSRAEAIIRVRDASLGS